MVYIMIDVDVSSPSIKAEKIKLSPNGSFISPEKTTSQVINFFLF